MHIRIKVIKKIAIIATLIHKMQNHTKPFRRNRKKLLSLNSMPKLLLIDGHALVFKMYYAFLRRPMINSKGADMSILFGFTKYLLELNGSVTYDRAVIKVDENRFREINLKVRSAL